MKKLRIAAAVLLVFMTLTALIPVGLLSASAYDAPTFESTFFPHGISAPPKPFLEVLDNEPGSESNGRIELWYTAPDEILDACEAYLDTYRTGGSGSWDADWFREQYHIIDWLFYVQIDVNVDNTGWQYAASWDENGDVGDNSWYLPSGWRTGERLINPIEHDTIMWAEDAAGSDLFSSITVSTTNGWDEEVFHLDLENHTLAVRTRFVCEYFWYDANDDWQESYVCGDWSPVASVGKNGNQGKEPKPASLPVPQIFDFEVVEPEDGIGEGYLRWHMTDVESYAPAMRWLLDHGFDPYEIHVEGLMRVNLGEWMELPVYGSGMGNALQTSYPTEHITPGCHVDVKFRVGSDRTGWSDWTPMISGGAEMYCDHPSFGTWHVSPDDEDLCERICDVCGYKDVKWHSEPTSVVLTRPTCTTEGTREYTCADCGHKRTEAIPTNDAHVFGAWVKKDNDTCIRTCILCHTATETQHHYMVEDLSRTVAATCGQNGSRVLVCSDCHFEVTETLPKLTTHRWSLTGNENSFWHSVGVDQPHERICPDCGLKETAPHTWDSGTVTKKATCAEEGVKTFHCTDCDASYTQPIAKTTLHSYKTTWKSDEAGHWHECEICHEKISYAFHTPGPEATEENAQLCTVCLYIIHPTLQHTHEVTSGWSYDQTGHWHYCTGCNEVSAFAPHTFDNDCDATCNICDYVRTITHVPGTAWGYDGTNHWHVCGKCGTTLETAAHIPGPAATEAAPQTCTVCGYILHPVLDHVHVWADHYTFDGENHWVNCTGCSERKSVSAHVYDNGCDPTCNICGNTRTVSHNAQSEWTSDGNDHWHVCAVCGEKLNTAKHVYDNACDPTCNICGRERSITHTFETTWKGDTGAHWHACSVCGVKSDAAAHVFDDDYDAVCNVCGYQRTVAHRFDEAWKHDETEHWHVCTDCGEKSDKAAHVYDNACDKTCNICGYQRTTAHKLPDTWTTDDANHWHTCEVCHAEVDKAAHTPGDPATAGKDQVCTVCGHVIVKATGAYEHNEEGHWSAGFGTDTAPDYAPHSFDADGYCSACGYLKVKETTAPETDTDPSAGTVTEPVTDPAAESSTDPSAGSETQPDTDPSAESSTQPDTEKDPNGGKKKCWLCGFCPCPLHICIFIWILLLLIIIGVVIFLLTRKTKCPNCGEKVSRKEKTCPKCGTPLGKTDKASPTANPPASDAPTADAKPEDNAPDSGK